MKALLRALPVALRGASGDGVLYTSMNNVSVPKSIPFPLAFAYLSACVPGLYFREIVNLIETCSVAKTSVFMQSLVQAVKRTLETYLQTVQDIETAVCLGTAVLSSVRSKLVLPTWYLKACLSILREVLHTFDTGEPVCLNITHRYATNGDVVIRKHAELLYSEVLKTFETIMTDWSDFGSLELDSFNEFFVARASTASSTAVSVQNSPQLNHRRKQNENQYSPHMFVLLKHKIPDCVTFRQAQTVFEKGKALYFIRTVCEDHMYNGKDRSCEEVCEYAYELLVNKFHLHLHLRGLRDYMFLTNGAYADGLFRNDVHLFMLDTLAETRPSDIGAYLLSAFDDMKGALQEDPRVFSQIDGKLMNFDDPSMKRNWEGFVCCYYMPSLAISMIIDEAAVLKYERCFAVLFRIRFSAYYLVYARCLLQNMYHETHNIELTDIMKVLREMYVPTSDMQQAFYYEKIGAIWSRFEKRITENKRKFTLHTITQEHDAYLNAIVNAVALPNTFFLVNKATHIVFEFVQLVRQLDRGTISALEVYTASLDLADAFIDVMNEIPLHSEKLFDLALPAVANEEIV